MVTTSVVAEDIKWCSVPLSEVVKMGMRLDASFFNVEGRYARKAIENNKWDKKPLSDIISKAYYPGRFKRIYASKGGTPFYLPSQMTDIFPKPEKYISALTKCNFNDLRLKINDLLLTRSGTIGKVTLISRTLEGSVFSDDVIRITLKDGKAGYLYAFLRSTVGNTILSTNKYGSVIQHIEPEHLSDILVPNPSDEIKEHINDLILRSFELRDQSNDLIDKATKLLVSALKLPPIDEIKAKRFDNKSIIDNFNVKLSNIDNRFDASYHVPIVKAITEHLRENAAEVTTIGDKRISKDIILPGRFKRVYVGEGQGKIFFSGKDIAQLDPYDKKYLSFTRHETRIKEQLTIHKNMMLVTCSGSIGKIALVPEHWDNWAMTHDIIRLVVNDDLVGYIYIWLQSEYARKILESKAYGSVVQHIEIAHVKTIPVPFLSNKDVQVKINRLALEANKLRHEAYLLEQQAIKSIETEVINQ